MFIGDITASPGRAVVVENVPKLRKKHGLDAVVANAENASGGLGLNVEHAQELFNCGIDVITLGNHTWDKKEIVDILPSQPKLLRPVNYPAGTMGRGFGVYEIAGKKLGVVNILGRLFMKDFVDCPFQYTRKFVQEHTLGEDYDYLLIDTHAETTSEKQALASLWNGHATAVVGSHTHIPTADERILSEGTGYQTDAGMCGTYDSVLGMKTEVSVALFSKQGKHRYQPADGEGTLCGVIITANDVGKCMAIERVQVGGLLQQTGG